MYQTIYLLNWFGVTSKKREKYNYCTGLEDTYSPMLHAVDICRINLFGHFEKKEFDYSFGFK